jgi:hypothetical protein
VNLHYSEDRWFALHQVADDHVRHHTTAEVTLPGFSWTDTSMSDGMHSVCRDLLHAGLISIGLRQPWGAEVLLTFEGSSRLSEWNLQHARGVA